jgi:archaellum component FlaF (FlaF/FlaG flagellin family)
LVSHFKGDEAGQFYLYSPQTVECGQDFEYHVYQKNKELRVRITNRGCNLFGLTMSDTNESLFDGTVVEFTEFCGENATA